MMQMRRGMPTSPQRHRLAMAPNALVAILWPLAISLQVQAILYPIVQPIVAPILNGLGLRSGNG
jgi:hypothetical protein